LDATNTCASLDIHLWALLFWEQPLGNRTFTVTQYFSRFGPLGDAVTLEAACYDVHIRPNKRGPEVPSVFEIQGAITDPVAVLQSRKDPESFFYIAPAGELKGRMWYTLVLARRDRPDTAFVSTAFNAERYAGKGDVIWRQGMKNG
jgi:hypothetical protein